MPSISKKYRQDLGHQHFLRFTSWNPDNLAPNRERYGVPLPNVKKAGAIIFHPNLKQPGTECISNINFDLPVLRKHWSEDNHNFWQVQQWNPLTLTPSLLCMECGDHGFIREGKWVPA